MSPVVLSLSRSFTKRCEVTQAALSEGPGAAAGGRSVMLTKHVHISTPNLPGSCTPTLDGDRGSNNLMCRPFNKRARIRSGGTDALDQEVWLDVW